MKTSIAPFNGKVLKRSLLLLAYPSLRKLPEAQWSKSLQRARNGNFDFVEWTALLAGVGVATYVLRFDSEFAAILTPIEKYLFQLVAALPLLLLLIGPFYLRRTRRNLDLEIERTQLAHRADTLEVK